MGHFSVEIYAPKGSNLNGNQQFIYPLKLTILSISSRWNSHKQKYWFCGYHLLNADWDGRQGWSFSDGHHVGFGLGSTHLKLKGLAKSLDPSRHLLGFNLDVDKERLRHHARLMPDGIQRRDFEQKLVACLENYSDLYVRLGGISSDINELAALRNDFFFKLDQADESEGWETQDPLRVGRYLRARNAFIWFSLLELTLNEQQISAALAAYFDFFYDKWPDPLRSGRIRVRR